MTCVIYIKVAGEHIRCLKLSMKCNLADSIKKMYFKITRMRTSSFNLYYMRLKFAHRYSSDEILMIHEEHLKYRTADHRIHVIHNINEYRLVGKNPLVVLYFGVLDGHDQ